MPRRGYRKGVDDEQEPMPHQVFTRLSHDDHRALTADAKSRSMDKSKLVRRLVKAHIRRTRAELPHATGPTDAALRELSRIGNNLNQIARHLNTFMQPSDLGPLKAALDELTSAARRL